MSEDILKLQEQMEQIKELKKQIEELKQRLSRPHLQCGKRLSIKDDEVVTLRKRGITVNAIAEKLNVSTATISRILRENKVKVIKVYNADVDTTQLSAADKEIVGLRKGGITVKAISEQLNVSTATVNRILMKNNIRASKVYNDAN